MLIFVEPFLPRKESGTRLAVLEKLERELTLRVTIIRAVLMVDRPNSIQPLSS